MTSNSSKFFRKILKNSFLVTASGAAIMLSSSGALGAALDVTADVAALQVGVATSLSAPWANANSLKLTGGFDITTGEDGLNIAGVDIDGNANQTFTVAHNNTVIGGALDMNLILTNAAGNTTVGSVGAGDVNVAGGVLGIGAAGQAVTLTGGQVNQTGVIDGDLDVSGGGVLAGAVGATDVLGTVTLQADAGAVTIRDAGGVVTVAGSTLGLRDAGNNMTITGGTVNQTGEIAGDLDVSGAGNLAGAAGVTDVGGSVTLQAGATGAVTIKDAAGAVAVAGGTLNLADAGTDMTITGGTVNQTGAIGGDLDVSGGGDLAGAVGATDVTGTVTLQADAGNVAIKDATGAVAVAGGTLDLVAAAANMTITGGTVNQTGAIAGDLDVSNGGIYAGTAAANVGGTVNVQANAGAVKINNANGNVTVAGSTLAIVDAAANMTITGGTVNQTGTIGGNLNVSGAGVLAGAVGATDVTGTVTLQADAGNVAIKDATGAVAVAGGTLDLVDAAANMTITGGTVNQTGTIGGNLNVSNGGNLAGAAGATDVTGTVTLQAGAGNVAIKDATGAVAVAGGTLDLVAAAANMTITGGTVNQTGAIAGDLDVSNGGIYAGTAAANVGGTVNVQANAGAVKINNATGAVTVAGSTLAIVDAAADMTITGGTVNQTGTIGGNLNVSGGGNLAGAAAATDVTGTVTLQATAGNVAIKDATGNVAVAGGTLDLVAAAANMTITGGTVNQTGAIAGDLDVSNGGIYAGDAAANVGGTVNVQANAGAVKINNATGAVTVAGSTLAIVDAAADMTITGGTVNQTGTIGGNLNVSNGGNLAGAAGATDVTGTVTLQAGAGNVVIKDATGAVTVAGGTLNLHDAAGGIDFVLGAGIGTTVTVAAGGNVNDVQNTTLANGIGILTFAGAGQAGIIGNANPLAALNVGAGEVAISGGVVKADAINLTNNASVLTFANAVAVTGAIDNTGNANNGVVNFNGVGNSSVSGTIGNTAALATMKVGAGTLTIDGAAVKVNNINLSADASVLTFTNPVAVTGNIDNTGNANNGVVNFNGAGNSSVSGKIGGRDLGGGNTSFIKTLNANVTANNAITLSGDVYTKSLIFDAAGGGAAVGTVEIGGNLTGDVTFGANNNGGTLEFNGNAVDAAGDPILYKFDGAIAANANKGTLKVNTTLLTATGATVTGLKEINIVNTKALAIDASNGDVTLPAVQTIAFAGANSGLGFSNTGNRDNAKIIFSGDFVPANDGQGRITFASADPNDIGGAVPKALIIISDNPANIRKIGTTAGPLRFTNLSVFDQVIVDKTIDLSGIAELDVINGANFVDQGATSAAIQTINIGADDGAGVGPATHTIDVSTAVAAVNLSGGNVKFADAGSTFKLQNTVAGNKIVTLTNNIEGNVANGAGGIVELNAGDAAGILTIDGNKTLGTDANKLQTLKLSGNGTIDLTGTDYFATNLSLSIKAVTLGNITQPLEFSGNTILTETGNIASVDFKGFDATINMNNGTNITGAVTNTVAPPTNNGTIEFKGTGYIGGNISGLAMLKVGAGAVELKTGGATKITEIQGTGTDTLTLGPDFKLTGAINSIGGLAVKLNFTNGGSVSGVVGTAASPVGGITTAGTTTFTSAVNSKGPIATAGNTTFSNSLNNIGDVTTTGTTTFTGAFNNQGAVNTNGTTTFKNSFTNQGDITLANATNFEGTFTNTGTLTTKGASSNNFTGTFTNTGAVILAPNSVNTFNQQITATSINASGSTLVVHAGLPISGTNLTGSGTTITLGSNQLLLSAGTKATFTEQLTLNSNFDGATNSGGNILITGANSKMDLSGVTKLKLVISTTNFDVNNVNPNTKYTLILAQDGGSLTELSSADIIETAIDAQENRFLKWTLNPSSLVLTASNISQEGINNAIKTGSLKDAPADIKESIEILARAPAGSEAGKFRTNLGFIDDNEVLVTEVIDSLQLDTVRTGDAVAAVNTQATSGAITSAITSLSSRMNNLQVANTQAAVAAGEEDEAKFGIWATPFVGNSTQKMRNNVNGNKSNFNGATVGFDGMLNDNLVLGVAYTRADSKIKQKNDKIGDKSKVNSNIYSIYGLYNLPTNNLFFEAVGSYGDSRVKNHTKHLLPTARNTITSQIAHGKYKSRSYTGQVMVGYDYVTAQANLTPMAGIRYSNIKDSGYTETGTTLQNLIVKGKKYNIVEGLAGAKVSTNVNVDQVILTPELYGLINYGFKNKAPAIDARLQGMDAPFPTNSFKSPKTSYNLGAGVTAKYQMMEYGINYDVNIASKYFAQQGSLKVRVNF